MSSILLDAGHVLKNRLKDHHESVMFGFANLVHLLEWQLPEIINSIKSSGSAPKTIYDYALSFVKLLIPHIQNHIPHKQKINFFPIQMDDASYTSRVKP